MLPDIRIIKLTVSSENKSAKDLYKALGFNKYGREPYSLFDGKNYHDEDLMYLDFSDYKNKSISD